MSAKDGLQVKNFLRVRFLLSSLASLSLAAAILWALLAIYSPTATLTQFNIRDNSTVFVEIEVHNQNRLRGFNYTDGWAEVFYITDPTTNTSGDSVGYEYITPEYQDFRKDWRWNLTKNISGRVELEELRKNETHFYVSLYLAYWYKIWVWKTETTNHQWLEANVYLGDRVNLSNPISFHRIKYFNLAIST